MVSPESIAAFRFGYGFRPGEDSPTLEAMLADLPARARAARDMPSGAESRMALHRRVVGLRRKVARGDKESVAPLAESRRALARSLSTARADRVRMAVEAPNPFYERLVWFWSDHFSVAVRGPFSQAAVPTYEIEAIRPHIAGSFAGLLRAAIAHPAMLDYLGQSRSVGPGSVVGQAKGRGLNENLARETLELHTVGVGAAYTQADVRELAELLTGLSITGKGRQAFRADIAEPGVETVLGHRYGGNTPSAADIDGVLADLARNPATARHIATKLAVHFVSDTPDPGLVDHLAEAWTRTGGDLMAVYEALAEHPASAAPLGAKVRQPFEFVVASLRAAPPVADGPDPVVALQRMNQPIWRVPQPNGWPELDVAWISPPGLTARIDWASSLAVAIEGQIDPRAFVDIALGDVARPETRAVARAAAERWEGIALVLAAPEFNRR